MTANNALLLGFAFVHFVMCQGTALTFTRFDDHVTLNGRICPDPDVVFSIHIGDVPDGHVVCLGRCSGNANCMSVFYNSATFTCTGCTGVYGVDSSLDFSVGTVYYSTNTRLYQENCLLGHVCKEPNQECFTDTCICSPGYSYNPNNKTCVESCDTYGTTFQKYEGRRINNDNLYRLTGDVSLSECMDECISNPLCISLDYKTSLCNIQNVSVLTTMSFFEEKTQFTFYARDCAWSL